MERGLARRRRGARGERREPEAPARHPVCARGAHRGLRRGAQRTCGRKKKLADAARAWARGGKRAEERRSFQEERAALAELGLPDDEIDAALEARAPAEEELFELWPENLLAYRLFVELETQWRVAIGFGASAHLGLDYGAAVALMVSVYRVKPPERADLMGDLRAMERAVLPIFNKRDEGED